MAGVVPRAAGSVGQSHASWGPAGTKRQMLLEAASLPPRTAPSDDVYTASHGEADRITTRHQVGEMLGGVIMDKFVFSVGERGSLFNFFTEAGYCYSYS